MCRRRSIASPPAAAPAVAARPEGLHVAQPRPGPESENGDGKATSRGGKLTATLR